MATSNRIVTDAPASTSPTVTSTGCSLTTVPADVLALKYAQGFHGADEQVMLRLADAGTDPSSLRPEPGAARIVPSTFGSHVGVVGAAAIARERFAAVRPSE